MDEKELESSLNISKHEAKNFFAKINMSAARQAVKARAVCRDARKPKATWPFSLKTGLVAVCLTCFAFIAVFIAGSVHDGADKSADRTVAQQTVSLGGIDGILRYFPVNSPQQRSDRSLMSVLWDVSGGNSKMLYNTMFEKCDEPYPASTLTFPDEQGTVLLISSGDSAGSFIDYRLIEYAAGNLCELLSKDVPGGVISVENNIVIEKYFDVQSEEGLVSYIVPYRLESGEIVLPAESLRLKVGERIMLVGDGAQVDIRSLRGLMQQLEGQSEGRPVFRATGAGADVLLLQSGSDFGYLNLQIFVD